MPVTSLTNTLQHSLGGGEEESKKAEKETNSVGKSESLPFQKQRSNNTRRHSFAKFRFRSAHPGRRLRPPLSADSKLSAPHPAPGRGTPPRPPGSADEEPRGRRGQGRATSRGSRAPQSCPYLSSICCSAWSGIFRGAGALASPVDAVRAGQRDNSTERRRSRPQSRGSREPATQPLGAAPGARQRRCAACGRPEEAAGSEEEEPGAGRRRSWPGFLPVGPRFRSMDRGRRVAAGGGATSVR